MLKARLQGIPGQNTMPAKGYKKPPEQRKKRERIITVNLYLGDDTIREKRRAKLDELAEMMGADNRSRLVQMICDGEIKLVRVIESQ